MHECTQLNDHLTQPKSKLAKHFNACSPHPLPKCEAHVNVCYILDGAPTPNNALAFPTAKVLITSAITSLSQPGSRITVVQYNDTDAPRIIVPPTTKGEAVDYAAKISAALQLGTIRNPAMALKSCGVRLTPGCYAHLSSRPSTCIAARLHLQPILLLAS